MLTGDESDTKIRGAGRCDARPGAAIGLLLHVLYRVQPEDVCASYLGAASPADHSAAKASPLLPGKPCFEKHSLVALLPCY